MYKFFTAALVLVLGAQAIQLDAEVDADKPAPAFTKTGFPIPKCGKKPKVNPLKEKKHA